MVKVFPVLTVVAPFRVTAPVPVVKVPVPGVFGEHGHFRKAIYNGYIMMTI
jgi:hypothetical protein